MKIEIRRGTASVSRFPRVAAEPPLPASSAVDPLRIEAEAVDRDMTVARRRMRFLRTPSGLPIEPTLPVEFAMRLQAREDRLAMPAGEEEV